MIPLYKPYMPSEFPELGGILSSGMLAYGKWGKHFENELARYVSNPNVLVVNSFNSAMLVALATIGIVPGDEVIASPVSCLASNQPLVSMGVKIVWADVDPSKGTLDPESVKSKITGRTKAIIHNHYCGYLGYIDEINALGLEHGLFIIDDSIEAFGARYKDLRMGNLGADITVCSFQTVRLPNSVDGGALTFKDEALCQRANMIRDYGIDRTFFRDEIGEINPECDITEMGFGVTLSEPYAYIGTLQMSSIGNLLDMQQRNAQIWKSKVVKNFPELVCLESPEYAAPNYWVFGLFARDKNDTILRFREGGYYASGVHINNNRYSVFQDHTHLIGVSDFCDKFVAIPCGWWLEEVDLNEFTYE
jgi:perosamine synthetase